VSPSESIRTRIALSGSGRPSRRYLETPSAGSGYLSGYSLLPPLRSTALSASSPDFTKVLADPRRPERAIRRTLVQSRSLASIVMTLRLSACQGWGRGFESLRPLQTSPEESETYGRAAKAALVVFASGVPPGFLVERCCLGTFGYVQTPGRVEPRCAMNLWRGLPACCAGQAARADASFCFALFLVLDENICRTK
jgi:hypothetical protein